jgi:hypothetical protein
MSTHRVELGPRATAGGRSCRVDGGASALTRVLLAVSLQAALPALSAGEDIASGIQFLPLWTSTADPNQSRLAIRGPHLLFNDGSAEPLKRTSHTGGLITSLAKALGTPLSVVVRGGVAYSSSRCTVFKASLDGTASTILALTNEYCDDQGRIAVDDANVYFTALATHPISTGMTRTIWRVPIDGGPPFALVDVNERVIGLATDGANVYWGEEGFPDRGAVRRIPVGGGATADLVAGRGFLKGFALRGSELFFTESTYSSYRIVKVAATGGPLTVLATVTSLDHPTAIAVDDTTVYWGIEGAVNAVPSSGGPVQTLIGGLDTPVGLAVTSNELFWTERQEASTRENGSLKKAPLAGGPVTILAHARDWPTDLAVDGSHVYWTEGTAWYGHYDGWGRIMRLPQVGGEPSVVADSGPGVLPPFAADDTHVYFANKSTLKKVPLGGGAVEQLWAGGPISTSSIQAIATDGSDLYWTDGGSSSVYRMPVTGGAVSLVGVGGNGRPGPMSLDGTNVYWVDQGYPSTIVRAPKTGGSVVTLARGYFTVSDLAVDGPHLLFSDSDSGAIFRMSVNGGTTSYLTDAERWSFNILALDQWDLYWIGQETIRRVPKSGDPPSIVAKGLLSTFVPNGLATDGRGGVYWNETARGTIKADFGVTPVTALSFAASASGAREDSGSAAVKVQLTTLDGKPLVSAAAVQYATADGSALAGRNYEATSGTLDVPAGTPSGALLTIVVPLLDDAIDGDELSFSMMLSDASGAALEPPTSQIVVIHDTDPPPSLSITDATVLEGDSGTTYASFRVTLSAASGRAVSVSFTTLDNGTATAEDDYEASTGTLTFPPGSTTKDVAVAVLGDHVIEADETFFVELSNPLGATMTGSRGVGTIRNDDVPGLSIADVTVVEPASGTRTATFSVTLAPTSSGSVTVDYQTADGTATASGDYQDASGTLSFPPGTATRTFAVTVNADADTEGVESFVVNLGSASGAPIAFAQGTGRIFDPGNFFTLVPCRLLDTRSPAGQFGGPALGAGQIRTFGLYGRCGIPASARGVSVNVTVTQPTLAGNLGLYEGGTPSPLASALNYSAGQTRANNAVVGLSTAGELAIRCAQASGSAHVIVDVNGYFE